jgi:hypothetical protein
MVKVLPAPSTLSARMRPAYASTMLLVMASPRPVPATRSVELFRTILLACRNGYGEARVSGL